MSGVRVELHPEPQSEIRSTVLWYEERRPDLGYEFIEELSKNLSRVERAPESFPVWPGTSESTFPIRRVVLDRFPYLIAFEVHDDFVVVLAVVHGKRRPLYWLRRSTQEPG